MRATTHLEGRLADQALVDDRPDAPQVGLGVVILRHDDFRGLGGGEVEGEDDGNGGGSHFNELSSKTRHAQRVKKNQRTDHVHG